MTYADLLQPLAPLSVGEFAPTFTARSRLNPKFRFASVAGHHVVLAFLPPPGAERDAGLKLLLQLRQRFDDRELIAFLVTREVMETSPVRDLLPGMRWFFDPEGELFRLYGADEQANPYWLLLDPMLRVLSKTPYAELDRVRAGLEALPPVAKALGAPPVAPVLIVPRVFEPAVCRRLIDHYEADGGKVSGVMREIDGKTVGVLDDSKRRRDADIGDQTFRDELRARLVRRLAPEIRRALRFDPTRIERFIVACYDAADGGFFMPHRDNTTPGTAHRKFAVSINLNAEEFEGGDLRFPEFGPRTYRPPTGGAVVFACSLLHEATPVTKGRRYAFLPFLYDEDGSKIREANRSRVDLSQRLDISTQPRAGA